MVVLPGLPHRQRYRRMAHQASASAAVSAFTRGVTEPVWTASATATGRDSASQIALEARAAVTAATRPARLNQIRVRLMPIPRVVLTRRYGSACPARPW